MFNRKRSLADVRNVFGTEIFYGEASYIFAERWDSFIGNISANIDRALRIQHDADSYNIIRELSGGFKEMLKGFEVKLNAAQAEYRLSPVTNCAYQSLLGLGHKLFADFRGSCATIVSPYNGFKIDGNEIEDKWFPKRQFHIFISHSHSDEQIAIMLAAALKTLSNLDVFVDSMVWGFRDDLIERLWNGLYLGTISEEEKRQRYRELIAHVDCMLGKSLLEMLDSCECLLFLNTPNSVTPADVSKRTHSPWIYSEIEASRFVRRHSDPRRPRVALANEAMDESPTSGRFGSITYKLPSHLKVLDAEAIKNWLMEMKRIGHQPFVALDALYRMYQ